MRSLLRCCNLCFSMYCKLPTFPTRWDPRDMRYVLCFFPLVGLVQGVFLLLWLTLCRTFSLQPVLQGALLAVLPLLYTGGIHMDGLCDTADALGSHQSRERMLEIL
jgi:adenosylcobinamide-GDP ribazoletransferase